MEDPGWRGLHYTLIVGLARRGFVESTPEHDESTPGIHDKES